MTKQTTMCEHKNFSANVEINRLTEGENGHVTGYTADVRVNCIECGQPFAFTGMPPGYDAAQPMVNVTGEIACLPMVPSDGTPKHHKLTYRMPSRRNSGN